MTGIEVKVSGDRWINRAAVMQAIADNKGAVRLLLQLNTEGPSLHALGIVASVMQGIEAIGLSPDRVWIDQWHNAVEQIPFRRAYSPLLSHFFWMSERYRSTPWDATEQVWPMAYFVGRLTTDRAAILRDILTEWPQFFLLSLMKQHGAHDVFLAESHEPWVNDADRARFLDWCRQIDLDSITNHWVRDQYSAEQNTNRDLVRHYGRFGLELVAETYCKGDTFFPTEKTVRPLSQGKPCLIYGPIRFLHRLHKLGFETYGDIWDESYDQLEGPDRWRAMKQEIQRILDQSLHLHSDIQLIADHNRKNLERLIQQHQPQ